MMTFGTLFVFCARALAAVGAAVAAMLLGWIITAHATRLGPDVERHDPILCERIPDMICQPDVPGLVTKAATLAAPHAHRPHWPRKASAGRALTNF